MDSFLAYMWFYVAIGSILLSIPVYAIVLLILPKWEDIPAFILPMLIAMAVVCTHGGEAIWWAITLIPVFGSVNAAIAILDWKRNSPERHFKSVALIVLSLIFLFGLLILSYILGFPGE